MQPTQKTVRLISGDAKKTKMAKYWLEFSDEYKKSPLSSWVHRPLDAETWLAAKKYDPPLPKKDIDKGYIIYKIEYKGCEFRFSSLEEIEHCISVFSEKALKTTRELSHSSWVNGSQHNHWLTKWPGHAKSYKDRQEIIKLLNKVKGLNT
jgi:hypothetical protein